MSNKVTVNVVNIDWHNSKCSKASDNNECGCNCCNYCNYYRKYRHNRCYNYNQDNIFENKDVILEYVFKQQIYYVRCVDGMTLNWFPNVNSNGKSYLNYANTFISPNLIANLNTIENNTTNGVPVVYPDYSSTDVGQGIVWPKNVFAPYVDSTAWPTYQFTDSKAQFFNLGFIVTQNYSVCQPSWATYYPAQSGPLNDQIKELRSKGGDVCVSFGGAAGMPLHIIAPDDTTLFKQYQLFCDAYGLTRIDFDIEGIWLDKSYDSQNLNNAKAIKSLQSYYTQKGKSISVWFTLPILPTGLTADGIRILQLAIDQNVEIGGVNAMTMDYGDSAAPNPASKMGEYGIQAITALKDQLNTLYNGSKSNEELWAMIGTTPMIGVNDVVTEIFTQADANQTLNFANQNNIGLISMWSSNRDLAGTSATGIVQQPNDFTNIFIAY